MVSELDNHKIILKDIPEFFAVRKTGHKYSLKFGKSKAIIIKIPFELDKKIVRICGMMPDASLSKNLSSISFCQGKDRDKVQEFGTIMKSKFNIKPHYYERERYRLVHVSNKSLCNFLHFCIDIYKSDQNARIPEWIKNSSDGMVREYLRYAFAMEGSIVDPKTSAKEIKFHSCDKTFIIELSEILKNRFGITSYIQRYFVKNYGYKYYISIGNKDNILKFSKIGF